MEWDWWGVRTRQEPNNTKIKWLEIPLPGSAPVYNYPGCPLLYKTPCEKEAWEKVTLVTRYLSKRREQQKVLTEGIRFISPDII